MGKKKNKNQDNQTKQQKNNNNDKKRPNTTIEEPKLSKKQKLEEQLEIELNFENYYRNKSADNRCLTIRDVQNLVLSIHNLASAPTWIQLKVKTSFPY